MILLAALILLAQDTIDGTASLNDGARVTASSTVQLRLVLKSPAPAGLEMSISEGPWMPYKESQPLELTAGDGDKLIVVKLRDAAGKERGVYKALILLDTTPPEAKVKVPPLEAAGVATLMSDVRDAVGMQWTEDAAHWGAWVPYLTPRDVALSAGDGLKTLLVRYRDEAGNVSKPATLKVESKGTSEAPVDQVRMVSVLQMEPTRELQVTLGLSFSGMIETSIQVDASLPLRSPYAPEKVIVLKQTGGAHRLRLMLIDAAHDGHEVVFAFQESDLPKKPEAPSVAEATAALESRWALSVQGGLLPSAIAFEAMTPTGSRKINKDALGLVRLSLSYEFLDPVYAQVGLEYAGGGGIRVYSGTLDVGARLFRAGPLDVAAEAGLMYSSLSTTESLFGDFDSGIGFRGGVRASFRVGPRASLEATIDYRRVAYDYSETITSGDSQARLSTVGLLLGASLKF